MHRAFVLALLALLVETGIAYAGGCVDPTTGQVINGIDPSTDPRCRERSVYRPDPYAAQRELERQAELERERQRLHDLKCRAMIAERAEVAEEKAEGLSELKGMSSGEESPSCEPGDQPMLQANTERYECAAEVNKAEYDRLTEEWTARCSASGIGESDELGLKDVTKPPAASKSPCDETFDSYHEREAERHEVLDRLGRAVKEGRAKKTQLDWCKSERPLCPKAPLLPIPAQAYQQKLDAYEVRKQTWDQKCAIEEAVLGAAEPWQASGRLNRDGLSLDLCEADCRKTEDKAGSGCDAESTQGKRAECRQTAETQRERCMDECSK